MIYVKLWVYLKTNCKIWIEAQRATYSKFTLEEEKKGTPIKCDKPINVAE